MGTPRRNQCANAIIHIGDPALGVPYFHAPHRTLAIPPFSVNRGTAHPLIVHGYKIEDGKKLIRVIAKKRLFGRIRGWIFKDFRRSDESAGGETARKPDEERVPATNRA